MEKKNVCEMIKPTNNSNSDEVSGGNEYLIALIHFLIKGKIDV